MVTLFDVTCKPVDGALSADAIIEGVQGKDVQGLGSGRQNGNGRIHDWHPRPARLGPRAALYLGVRSKGIRALAKRLNRQSELR